MEAGDDTWVRDAECARRGIDPNLFFPEPGGTLHRDAIAACRACPVRLACLNHVMRDEALARPVSGRRQRFGYWGGLTSGQRARLAEGKRGTDMPLLSVEGINRKRKARAQ